MRAHTRPEYVVVYYIEPMEGNLEALGFDVASDRKRLDSIEKARDTGEIIITEKINLVQTREEHPGVLILYPIYKRGGVLGTQEDRRMFLEGFATGVLHIDRVFQEFYSKRSWELMNAYLYDESANSENQLLYQIISDSLTAMQSKHQLETGFHWVTPFEVGGRNWKIILTPTNLFWKSHESKQAWIILAGMLLFTFFLIFYLQRTYGYTMILEREISERKRTEVELQKSSMRLRHCAGSYLFVRTARKFATMKATGSKWTFIFVNILKRYLHMGFVRTVLKSITLIYE